MIKKSSHIDGEVTYISTSSSILKARYGQQQIECILSDLLALNNSPHFIYQLIFLRPLVSDQKLSLQVIAP